MRRLLAPLLLLTLAACSQVPSENVSHKFAPTAFGPGIATSLAKHSSGVYVAGNIYVDNVPYLSDSAFIRKYDTNGAVLWSKRFSVQNYTGAVGVASDGKGNAYVVGETRSSPYDNLFLRKYTPAGKAAWTRQISRTYYSHQAGDVAVYGDSVYVVWLAYKDSGDPEGGIGIWDIYGYLRKYDKSGNIVWTRRIGTSDPFPDIDAPRDVAIDGSGNVYVAGSTYGSLSGSNGGGDDMFIRKYSPTGKVLWTRQHHYSSLDSAEYVAVSGKNVYLVGSFFKDDNWDAGRRMRIIKYKTDGSVAWNKDYGSYGVHPQATDADADSKGNLYVTGTVYISGTGHKSVIKLSPSGSYVWKRLFDTFTPNAVLPRTDSQVYVGGPGLLHLRGSDGKIVWADR